MKVTSFEISENLWKIGFRGANSVEFFYNEDRELCRYNCEPHYPDQNSSVQCFAWDLETILEALPEQPKTIGCDGILIRIPRICDPFISTRRPNESLADTAARLLILLHEKGILNFK